MPRDKAKIASHVEQWKHNRALIAQIPASHPDWIVTVVFYTAVHAVDAALAFEEASAWNHETRFTAIAGIPRMLKIGKLYHPLYDLCRKVRYTADPNQWIPPTQIERQVVRGQLLPLEHAVEKLMASPMNLPELDLSHLIPPAPKS